MKTTKEPAKVKQSPSAFKILLSEMLIANGDWSKMPKDFRKPLKCFVKESYPYFLVTDGYFFLQAYFTKEALDEFKQKYGGEVKITNLESKVIVITSWSMEMRVLPDDDPSL
jgi:hypothetical protein